VLQVHDELIVEAKKTEAEYVRRLVKEEMEGACALSVPLVADAGMGDTWYDAKA
jgi:DNA polymerase-1